MTKHDDLNDAAEALDIAVDAAYDEYLQSVAALALSQSKVTELGTAVADLTAKNAAQAAEIERLKALIPVPPVVVPPTSVIPAAPAGWITTFSDDFRKPALDTTKWNIRTGPLGAPREEYNRAENIATGINGLVGTTKREALGGKQWTSWYIDSANKMTFGMNSRIECQFAMDDIYNNASGLWPCPLWLRGDWPGEIDGPEMYGWPFLSPARTNVNENNAQRGNFADTIHSDTNGGSANKKTVIQPVNAAGGNIKPSVWYTAAIELTDAGIGLFLNDKLIVDTNGPNPLTWTYLATLGIQKSAFTGTGHARIQTQVGSSYWGPSGPLTASPWRMSINWFRILKKA